MVLSLTVIYLILSVGILKSTHLCMGRKASVTYFTSESKKCPCSCYRQESASCCDNEHDLIRIKDEQKIIPAFSLNIRELFQLEELYVRQYLAYLSPEPSVTAVDNQHAAPPGVALFKVHCSFVFYDDESPLPV
ncbi:MAG: HYC_CC_PP family protein [Bacteroidota bacterium]